MTEVYEGPQLTPPRISLLTAADLVVMTEERWNAGFDLIEEGCEDVKVFAVCPPENATPKTVDGGGANQTFEPYVLYATDACSTFGSQRRAFYDRAQRKLLTGEAAALEEILWTGSFDGTSLPGNPNLAGDSSTIASPVTAAKDAFAVLEQHIAECSATQGMIHVRPQVLVALLEARAIRREGNVYLSPLDNLVVGGRGYPGTGPAGQAVGATEWMYGHPGIVQVRRGPVIRLGEESLANSVNRLTNDRLVVVERAAHVALDPTCCVFAIDFTSLG